jgi:hypothetical protein
MVHVIQPALSAIVGFALAIYGFFHVATHIPPREVFHMFWSALPSVATVFVFLLGVIAIGIGLTLVTHGIQSVRRRMRTVNQMFRGSRMEQMDPDEDEYGSAYGYR